jgi:hypothetical protein
MATLAFSTLLLTRFSDRINRDIASTAPGAARNANVPKEIASDQIDVSPDVVDKHYEQATESERRERRRDFLDGV